jgi:Family of unknown function (DUF6152)
MTHRRHFIPALLALAGLPVLAHHGWSSFDQDKPLYLAGTVKSVRWQNPHAEFVLTVPTGLAVPADLASRKAPAQSQTVDAGAIFKKVAVPAQATGDWEIELAPLSRMSAWSVAELKPGDRVELVGYSLAGSDKRVFRVEYLMVQGKVYGLRSSPQ